MKTAVLSILLLTIYQAEGLKCNFCMSAGSELCTPQSVQTCSWLHNACGAVILQSPINRSFRQCMNMDVCQSFIKTPGAIARCCDTDLCN